MKLHLEFVLIAFGDLMPEAEYWNDDENSQLSVIAGAGAVEIDDDGGCWYRMWDRTHGLSHEEELEHLPEDKTGLQDIINHLRRLVEQIDKRYD